MIIVSYDYSIHLCIYIFVYCVVQSEIEEKYFFSPFFLVYMVSEPVQGSGKNTTFASCQFQP